VEDERIPPKDSAVRAECTIAGWRIIPFNDEVQGPSSRVEYISLSDIKGWVPGVCLSLSPH